MDALRCAPVERVEKPVDLLRAIRKAIAKVPGKRLDMRQYPGSATCGCALVHAQLAGLEITPLSWRDVGLDRDAFCSLFDNDPVFNPSYQIPHGPKAKREFLARIDAHIARATGSL